MTVTEQPNREDLHKAAELIQAAHDYIEVHGFNIMHYTPRDRSDGAACYIGTLRMAAGIDGQPIDADASLGDGPELGLALAELDRLALARIARLGREGYDEECGYDLEQDTGRMVEHLGFLLSSKATDKYPGDLERQKKYERDYALQLLRKALTTIYR